MEVALIDILRPYFFVGMDLGAGINDVLSFLHIDEYDAAWDDDAVVISGIARIDSDKPASPFFSPLAGGGSTASSTSNPSNDPMQWEWHDAAVRFRITLARRPAAALQVEGITNTEVSKVLDALGNSSTTDPRDYPNTQFRMELMFELVTVTIPWLTGAKLEGFTLVPDPVNQIVKISLPRVLLILTQDSADDTNFEVSLGSFGAETLDDVDPAIANLLRMNPPYALIPGNQCGFGFKKAVLDLSDARTPPELLDRFGVGDNWHGIYLPEIRFFASTQKSAGIAFNIGVREMLIGFDPTPGLWGEFNIDIDLQGNSLKVNLRLYSSDGVRFDPELVPPADGQQADHYRVTIPSMAAPATGAGNSVLFVDIASGAAPFEITAVAIDHNQDLFPDSAFFDNQANSPQDISSLQRMSLSSDIRWVAIRVVSTRNPSQTRILVLDVYSQTQTSPRPAVTEVSPAILEQTGVVI